MAMSVSTEIESRQLEPEEEKVSCQIRFDGKVVCIQNLHDEEDRWLKCKKHGRNKTRKYKKDAYFRRDSKDSIQQRRRALWLITKANDCPEYFIENLEHHKFYLKYNPSNPSDVHVKYCPNEAAYCGIKWNIEPSGNGDNAGFYIKPSEVQGKNVHLVPSMDSGHKWHAVIEESIDKAQMNIIPCDLQQPRYTLLTGGYTKITYTGEIVVRNAEHHIESRSFHSGIHGGPTPMSLGMGFRITKTKFHGTELSTEETVTLTVDVPENKYCKIYQLEQSSGRYDVKRYCHYYVHVVDQKSQTDGSEPQFLGEF